MQKASCTRNSDRKIQLLCSLCHSFPGEGITSLLSTSVEDHHCGLFGVCWSYRQPNPKMPGPCRSSSAKTKASSGSWTSCWKLLEGKGSFIPFPWVSVLSWQWASSSLCWLFCWHRLELSCVGPHSLTRRLVEVTASPTPSQTCSVPPLAQFCPSPHSPPIPKSSMAAVVWLDGSSSPHWVLLALGPGAVPVRQ